MCVSLLTAETNDGYHIILKWRMTGGWCSPLSLLLTQPLHSLSPLTWCSWTVLETFHGFSWSTLNEAAMGTYDWSIWPCPTPYCLTLKGVTVSFAMLKKHFLCLSHWRDMVLLYCPVPYLVKRREWMVSGVPKRPCFRIKSFLLFSTVWHRTL